MADNNTFRILSLDGGGVRGYLTVQILANIESYLNSLDGSSTPLGKRFDFIVGTSTGGLIALGLSVGKSASELVRFYQTHIPNIFSKASQRSRLKRLFDSKFDQAVFKEKLQLIFDSRTLNDVTRDVCVASISLQNAKPRFFKSDYLARNEGRLDELLVDIALSTSAAPTYFPAHTSKYSRDLIDGGLCANNPAMVALVDACQFERPSLRGITGPNDFSGNIRDKVRLLSVGTGSQSTMPYKHKELASGGLLPWLTAIAFMEISMESQSELIHNQAAFLLKDSYIRINPLLKFPMKMDDADHFRNLSNLADIDSRIENFIKETFMS